MFCEYGPGVLVSDVFSCYWYQC